MNPNELQEALAIAFATPSHFVETGPDGAVVMRDRIHPFWLGAIAHLEIQDGQVTQLTLKDRLPAIERLLAHFDRLEDAAIAIPT